MDVFCVGPLIVDVVVRPANEYPPRGRAEQVEKISMQNGGCGGNTSVTLAKLGIKVGLGGRVGKDIGGRFLKENLQAMGVDVRWIGEDKATGTCMAIVLVSREGERSFYYYPGVTPKISLENLKIPPLKTIKVLHIASPSKLESLDIPFLLGRAKGKKIITSLDTDWDLYGKWLETLNPMLDKLDFFFCNEEEAKFITGESTLPEMGKFLLSRGVKTVVIKRGERGCWVCSKQGSFSLPAYEVKPVDTTGAGDAFVGGFLAGVVKGWNLEEAARLGNAAGALCVTSLGATTGTKGWKKTLEFMEKGRLKEK